MSEAPQVRQSRSGPRGRFWIETEEGDAELTLSFASDEMAIADHTGVPEALEGRGLASTLVRALVADAQEKGYRIVPLCPFVAAWARRNPEHARLFISR
ncbi:GNAT family N-acetyltransferase [Wenxinia saemankumensis]|uniref:N-acetyltransferase domain-containing protein n=1 Tax=Wenxinia saemankumensis TaxID=1447782 RepID=A0A1M6GV56_9RHOB|nr:GNAT family N-acetyltransferase [Wenxinia saemankumensis]SHJ13843.1 hypothetical protein SAMN05444417_2946 [Wenxinia saemankumensis]